MFGLQEAGEDVQILAALNAISSGFEWWRPDDPDLSTSHTPVVWRSIRFDRMDEGLHRLLPKAVPPLGDGGPGGNADKWAIWARLRHLASDRVVRLVNTHLIAGADNRALSPRRRQRYLTQLEELARFVEMLPADEVVFVTMDANTSPDDPDLDILRSVGLVCCWDWYDPDPSTFDPAPARPPIDHVWHRAPAGVVTVRRVEVFERLSDHDQVNATYQLEAL